jgi:hypothetical protein
VPLQPEHHVEQRIVRRVPLRRQLLDQDLERELLVGVSAERRLADPAQDLGERRVPGQVRPQHQRVDEEADERLQLGPVAAGHRGADRDVMGAAVPGKQRLKRGEQRDERRAAVRAGQCTDPGRDRPGNGELGHRPRTIANGAAGPVGGQREDL